MQRAANCRRHSTDGVCVAAKVSAQDGATVRVGLCQFNQRNGARNGLNSTGTCANDLVKAVRRLDSVPSVLRTIFSAISRRAASEALKVVMRFC